VLVCNLLPFGPLLAGGLIIGIRLLEDSGINFGLQQGWSWDSLRLLTWLAFNFLNGGLGVFPALFSFPLLNFN